MSKSATASVKPLSERQLCQPRNLSMPRRSKSAPPYSWPPKKKHVQRIRHMTRDNNNNNNREIDFNPSCFHSGTFQCCLRTGNLVHNLGGVAHHASIRENCNGNLFVVLFWWEKSWTFLFNMNSKSWDGFFNKYQGTIWDGLNDLHSDYVQTQCHNVLGELNLWARQRVHFHGLIWNLQEIQCSLQDQSGTLKNEHLENSPIFDDSR